ncbi:MAG: LLM class flavin-dependent oxidoreductase, partial [Candidatus Rokuibacteriota bacterium]
MQFGLFMMPLHPPARGFADAYDRDLEQLVLADRLGFREAWVGEHLTERWENAPAPDLLIAQALALTKRIHLGTGVTLLALHHPLYLAHRLAMLDHMARGRFQWGIGGGAIPTDLSLMGLDHTDSTSVRARSAEVLDVVLKLWASEGPFSYRGRFFTIDTPAFDSVKARGYYMKPYQQPHPPIGVAAASYKSPTLMIAGEQGFLPMSLDLNTDYVNSQWEAVTEGAQRTGKTVSRREWRLVRDVYVAETDEAARHQAINSMTGRVWREYLIPLFKELTFLPSMKHDP